MAGKNVRIVDPILTTHAHGYKQAEMVGDALFPHVPVPARGGQVLEFNKAGFRLYNSHRARGANTKRLQFGFDGKPFALKQNALEGMVSIEDLEDAKAVPGIDMGMEQVDIIMGSIALGKEVDKATLARDSNNYDTDHKIDLSAAKWSDDTNDPIKDLKAGKEAIRQSIGSNPNTLVLSPTAFNAISENAKVLERFKYTSSESVTEQMIAKAVGLKHVVVGEAVFADEDDTMHDVWGKDAVMAYVAQKSGGQSRRQPSFGYTYTLKGHPLVEKSYYDQNAKSWIYPVTDEATPVLTGMTAGYLFQNVA